MDSEVGFHHGAKGEVMHNQVIRKCQGCIHCLCHTFGMHVIRSIRFPEGCVGAAGIDRGHPDIIMTALSLNVFMKFS